jgi:hypothetical protein
MLYAAVLLVHSYLRWLVILAGLIAFVRAVSGASRRASWTPADDKSGFWFVTAVDTQALLGILLYGFLSPVTRQAFGDFAGAMGDSVRRFWAVEHIVGMIVGLALVHVGRARTRRADSLRRHKVAAIFFGLALVVILASIPWPGTPAGRPLLRW